MRFISSVTFFLLALMLVVGCPDDEGSPAGESCTSADDCADSQCITGGSFPGGVCTPACETNADCPGGFSCISRSSGICLKNCTDTDQCQTERGDTWQCREESLEDGDGNVNVCIGE